VLNSLLKQKRIRCDNPKIIAEAVRKTRLLNLIKKFCKTPNKTLLDIRTGGEKY
jgi:hypothetical protein